MDVTVNLTAVVFLLVANGFFVAAEFALVKARGFRIELHANQGSAAAKLTLQLQQNLEAYLAACQLGITMASLGLGWVGEPTVAALLEPLFHWAGVPDAVLHAAAFIVGFLIFSSLHIVVGEQVPKTFAIRKAETVALWVAYPLQVTYLLVWPLNWLLNRTSGSILALFNIEEANRAEVLSSEELKGLVATSGEHGKIERDKAEMLHNLLEFDQHLVGRVMIPRGSVHALDVSAPPQTNLHIIRETEHSRLPVIDGKDDDAVVGILLTKDIYSALLAGEKEPWRNLKEYCREPLIVPESQRIAQLFELMRTRRAHLAFVVDEYGEFIGIVTLEDLLEEIVGEIQDETDNEEPSLGIMTTGDGRWEADGLASLGDLQRVVGLQVPDSIDANTLSGLFMQRLARMPEPGDTIEEPGFSLRVLSLEDRRVGRAVIEQIDEARETDKPSPDDRSNPKESG